MKKNTLTRAKKRAWQAFSKYIRIRDSKGKDYLLCFTCNKSYPAFGVGCAQAGHFIPGRHSSILFDERNAHGQCYNCNINLKGNWRKYEDKMLEIYGKEIVEELKALDRTIIKYRIEDYLELEEKYKNKVKDLE